MPTLTPNQAAARIGTSRRSIMRAIEAREIDARRDNRNQWQIDEDALAQWARSERAQPVAQPAPSPEMAVLEERVRGLEMLLGEMRTSNEDLRKDRDAWRVMAQRPWWKRLAG